MCGIVGLMTTNQTGFINSDVTSFEQMIYADQLRGSHGTGMFYDTRVKNVGFIRGAMNASDFLVDAGVKKALSKVYMEASFVVGHNRYATRGAHTNDNTHPFNEGHITLVHNGTLSGHRKMKDVEVDSHAVTHAFAEKGAIETLKTIDGAFAFVWYDDIEGQLHFIRNSQRPLYMVKTATLIAISSEARLADWILTRNGNKVISTEACEEGMMYSFDRDTRQLTSEKVEIMPYKEKDLSDWYSGRGLPTATSHSSKASGYWSGGKWIPFSSNPVIVSPPASTPSNVRHLPAILSTPVNDLGVNIGDMVDFSPLSVDPKGRGWQLTMIKQGPLDSPDVFAIYYHGDRKELNDLLEFDRLQARVTAIRQKHGKQSLVVTSPIPVMGSAPTTPLEIDDEDYSAACNAGFVPFNGLLN